MVIYTGVDVLDSVFRDSYLVLFFGPAGCGKTAVLTTIARNACREVYPCIYVNTEDPLFYDNIARMWEEYSGVFFIDIHDFNDFFDFIVKHLVRLPYRILFIDSVNSTFRVVAHRENTSAKLNLALALLARGALESGYKVFASAQVRAEMDSDETTASGMSILRYWFNTICKLGWENNSRFVKVIKPPLDLKLYFKISSRGVEWVAH